MQLTVENAAEMVDQAIPGLSVEPTEPKSGRGVVIAAGGIKFQIGAWVTINMLRKLGCALPVEVWYLGIGEYNAAWDRLVETLGVTCVDAHEVRRKYPHARLHGWELKPYAIQHSKFAEVLFLDADNVPVVDPTFLFETEQYKQSGAIFWPDYGRLGKNRQAWKVFGDIPYRDEPEVESGQIVVDKLRCWKALELCHWYMQNSNNFFFHHVHGDKEIFHLAWRKLEMPYAMPSRGIHSLDGTMCQHDFDGRRIFQHRNMKKWRFNNNETVGGFEHEEACLAFIADLTARWSPAAQTLPSDADREDMAKVVGKPFLYVRVGYGSGREMVFDADGTISKGSGGCERYWTMRSGELLIADDGGRLMMELSQDKNGVWSGKWLHHERMPVLVIPTAR
jgi:hypothetical protein